MSFRVVRANKDDLPDIADVFTYAMEADPFWKAMEGPSCTFEEQHANNIRGLSPRLHAGAEFGACQTWKVIDEDGYVMPTSSSFL